MKYLFFGLMVSCSCMLAAGDLEFNEVLKDFGRILNTEKVTWKVDITNFSDSDIVITNIKATCGCTVPEIEKSELKSHESTGLKIVFDPSSFMGFQKKMIYVFTDKGERYVLSLQATVVDKYSFTPEYIRIRQVKSGVLYDVALTVNDTHDRSIIKIVPGHKSVVLTDVQADRFSFSLKEHSDLPREIPLKVYLKNKPDPLIYNIYVDSQSQFKFSPEKVTFLNIMSSKENKRRLTLNTGAAHVVKVDQINSDPDWINVSVVEQTQDTWVFDIVSVPEKMKRGAGKGSIVFSFVNSEDKKLELSVPVIFNVYK